MSTARRPDAILCPRDFPPTLGPRDSRDVKRNKLFGPIFGTKRVQSVGRIDVLPPGESFVYPIPDPDPKAKASMFAKIATFFWPDPRDAPRMAPEQTLFFKKAHPLEGEDRYEWFVAIAQKDGTLAPGLPVEGHPAEDGRIKLGYLKDDPWADDPAVLAAMHDEYERRSAEHFASPEYRDEMKRRGIVLFTDPEREQIEAELRANPPSGTATPLP